MLVPNVWVHPAFGKFLFSVADIIGGLLIAVVVKGQRRRSPLMSPTGCAALWLFNPLTAAISTRGNAEPLVACVVLLMIWAVQTRRWWMSGALIGLGAHLKIFPGMYCLPAMLCAGQARMELDAGRPVPPHWKKLLSDARCQTVLGAAISFGLLFVLCYSWCGDEFVEHTYLYHLGRKDHRHNFSPYFYLIYLLNGTYLQ